MGNIDETEKLQQYTRQLCRKTGKLNLYICFCCKKSEPDNIRLKEEMGQIKLLISDIEEQMKYI